MHAGQHPPLPLAGQRGTGRGSEPGRDVRGDRIGGRPGPGLRSRAVWAGRAGRRGQRELRLTPGLRRVVGDPLAEGHDRPEVVVPGPFRQPGRRSGVARSGKGLADGKSHPAQQHGEAGGHCLHAAMGPESPHQPRWAPRRPGADGRIGRRRCPRPVMTITKQGCSAAAAYPELALLRQRCWPGRTGGRIRPDGIQPADGGPWDRFRNSSRPVKIARISRKDRCTSGQRQPLRASRDGRGKPRAGFRGKLRL